MPGELDDRDNRQSDPKPVDRNAASVPAVRIHMVAILKMVI
jgi:hypothetical protein